VFLSRFKPGITTGPSCYLLTNMVLFKDDLIESISVGSYVDA